VLQAYCCLSLVLLYCCLRDKIKSANPGFLEEALALLVTHAMADHRPAVEYVYGQLGRPLPQVHAPPVTVRSQHLLPFVQLFHLLYAVRCMCLQGAVSHLWLVEPRNVTCVCILHFKVPQWWGAASGVLAASGCAT
jgi:hypothetical protein